MTSRDTLDLDIITILRDRIGRLDGPDRRLGVEILASAEPGTEVGRLARFYLDSLVPLGENIPRLLDITGSLDAAFAFLERHLDDTEWSMMRLKSRVGRTEHEKVLREEGPYHIRVETSDALYLGNGLTKPACVVDVVLRTLLHLPVEAPKNVEPLQAFDGLASKSDNAEE
jgi:hypothetical protein